MTNDRIAKVVELKAPRTRVWRAIADHVAFGEWFRVALEGPFVVGQTARGRVLHPGYEHLTWAAEVAAIEPNLEDVFVSATQGRAEARAA